MNTVVRQQAKELITFKRQLAREILRRETAEASLKASKRHYGLLLAQAKLAREQKLLLARQVLLAQEEERRRISRTLHDEISQTLAGINVRLATLSQEASFHSVGLRKKIAGAQRLVEKSVNIVHQFARELRPMLLDDLGLIPALHAFMKILTQRTGLQIRFTAFAGVEKLSNAKRTAFYRVAQSALTNVVKHAKATRVIVNLKKNSDGICLEIKDDGKSFKVEQVLSAVRYKRLGLLSMRERIEMFGGAFTVESAPGKGTTVRATIPLGRDKI